MLFGRSTLRAMPITVRTAGAVALAVTLFSAPPAHADDLGVVIRLYDLTSGDARGRVTAMRTASGAIATAGLKVQWRDCSRGGAAHPCRSRRETGDLVVRVMPGQGPSDAELGFAPIDPAGRATVIATVYYGVVLRVARRTGLGADELLGRAIAHEIGHLLLRARGHAPSGLMRPLWTDEELIQNHPDDWTFSDSDRRQVQAIVRDSDPALAAKDESGGTEATGR